MQRLEVKGIRLGVRWAETPILLEESYEASVSVLLVGDVKYHFWFDVSPPQASWMVLGDILSVHQVLILARGLDQLYIWHGVWRS